MKEQCFYRDNSYFNDNDYFLMYDPSLKKLYLNTASCGDKGGAYYSKYIKALNYENNVFIWHNRGPSEFKLTSIPCVNYNELIGKRIRWKGTGITGKITKRCVLNSFGIFWDKHLTADDYKKWGFPCSWADPNHIEFLP